MKEHIAGHVHTILDKELDKLLKMLLGMGGFDYIKEQYSLIIFGDSGKPIIVEKVLGKVVGVVLGAVKDDIHITVILDEDGVGYSGLKKDVSDKLKSISKDRSKFTNCFPTIKEHGDSFTLNHPKGRGTIEV
ncbi:MAG: hypothetical protein LAKADJCE_00868 [Candidatus Argoarchaeum ethanivorans]|uniref:Uncharacterized protein n=1 Tax=Candidatus Argoarchaeum ethanivorans TaxID=2608793 RepID=A0A811TGM4_9EURY|nr:MAG: hypothetical protein LAKADJCE_00868 [Candidatus Argoarchaeum ethanivorans]